MSKLTSQAIRSTFLNYFKQNNHEHIKSSSLVPHNDPSLMFVNAGMVQFKDVFTGVEKRDYTKATTSQKCVRAGGKHNDLDNVGYTARHHTFFEMLGNFSFGDYFKEEAIYYSWDLLTNHYGLPKDKLYITVYHEDTESANIWKKLTGFTDEKIIKISTNDNFWSMGDTGPCGPCTEIFYDHGDHIPGGLPGTPEEDGDRFIEIWNLVFMQYEQVSKDKRILLPKQSVDTGMGLERISAVIQGVHDNYDTDMFKEIIGFAESIIKAPANGEALFSYRVIADHLRSCAFLIADGVMPSNEGRGYVLRRIMRRAMRHAHQLGAKEPVMHKLFPKLEQLFSDPFIELSRANEFISSVLKQEEERFKTTLGRGLKLLNEEIDSNKAIKELSGDVAFKLYDTYGFPLDLTQDILKKKDIKVDVEGFEKSMKEQKDRARKSWSGSGDSKTDQLWFNLLEEKGATEFLGYSQNIAEANIIKLVQDGQDISEIKETGAKFTLIANQTPFYGESGGQMGDIGFIENESCRIKVLDTQKYLGKIIAHKCILESGKISAQDSAKFTINTKYRNNLRKHHTATHILHAVLRDLVGKHITQKGSLVAHDRLRFDISHPKALNSAEIRAIEEKVNYIIQSNSEVLTQLMSTDDALEKGAMALFGEKYDSEVRVVSLAAGEEEENSYSFELCGGTHVKRAGDIGCFKILNESAVAAGIRRIEAVCGEFALAASHSFEDTLNNAYDILKTDKTEFLSKLESIVTSKKQLEKEIEKIESEKLNLSKEQIESCSINIKDARLIYKQFSAANPKSMRSAVENIAKSSQDIIVIFASKNDDKIMVNIAVSKEISANYSAGDISKKIANIIDGSGGGKPTLAQVGGKDIGTWQDLQQEIEKIFG